MTGRLIKSTGSWYIVETENGTRINCILKGKFRIKGIKATNPLAVGDKVDVALQPDQTGIITKIYPRRNYIVRKATKTSKVSHIIAANIDQALVVVSLTKPRTTTGFIDRFLITAEAYHIPSLIVINKIDLYDDELKRRHEEVVDIYKSATYPCISVSALSGENMSALKEVMCDKTSLMAGHSGVGKSAILNKLEPGLDLKTKEISTVHLKGRHTTTFAEMHSLTFGGFVIDTPGIKEFGLIDFDKHEVAERFPEMRALMHQCKFHNCTHIHEPGCAVKEALKTGEINENRYKNYLRIVNNDNFDEILW